MCPVTLVISFGKELVFIILFSVTDRFFKGKVVTENKIHIRRKRRRSDELGSSD